MSKTTLDIRNASQCEFEDFVFDHDVHGAGSDKVWYHQFELVIDFDAKHNALCFTEMFNNAQNLLTKFDRAKLEQGCWAMFGAGFDGNLEDLIWNHDIAVETKEILITSMYFLYRDLFSLEPLGSACEMWWDGLAYDIHPMQRADPTNNPTHKRIQNAMFVTLSRILRIDNTDCQLAALHGLNHVVHPDTEGVVKEFVESHPDLTDEQVEYAILCANGLAM